MKKIIFILCLTLVLFCGCEQEPRAVQSTGVISSQANSKVESTEPDISSFEEIPPETDLNPSIEESPVQVESEIKPTGLTDDEWWNAVMLRQKEADEAIRILEEQLSPEDYGTITRLGASYPDTNYTLVIHVTRDASLDSVKKIVDENNEGGFLIEYTQASCSRAYINSIMQEMWQLPLIKDHPEIVEKITIKNSIEYDKIVVWLSPNAGDNYPELGEWIQNAGYEEIVSFGAAGKSNPN